MKPNPYDIDALIEQSESHDWHPAIQDRYVAYLNRSNAPYLDAFDWLEAIGAHEVAAICSEYHDRLKQLNPKLIQP
jgi:hypothetical protein